METRTEPKTSAPKWEQVFNAVGERSRGLWKRGERYYVQTTVTDPQTGLESVRRIILPNAKTEPQARKEAEAVKIKAAQGDIYRKQGSPTLSSYIPHYLSNCHKAEHTKENEKIYLEKWLKWFGDVRLSNITTAQILAYRTEALKEVSKRTVNVRVNALKSLLKLAKLEGKIQELPTDGIVQLKHTYKKKTLLKPAEVELIIATAESICKRSGKQFADYVKLLAYSGGREHEVLALKWSHIDFERKLVHFQDATKFDKERFVNFNPKLEAHLQDMYARRNPALPWLFPSCRKVKDANGNPVLGYVTTFKKTQQKIEAKTGLDFSDHSFRHYFASMAVMNRIDFMTVSRWLGHTDGGMLVGRTYGHLLDSHLIESAKGFSNL